jgi:ribonuclease Y
VIGIGIAIGIAGGVALALLAVSVFGTTGVSKARRIRDQLLDDARRESDAVRREAQVEAREQAVRLRSEIDTELADRRAQVLKIEERVLVKELEIEKKLEELTRRDQGLADREEHIRQLQDEL